MVTARALVSLMLTLTAVAMPAAAQTVPPIVTSAEDAQALGGLLPDIIDEIPKHLSVQNTRQREWLRFSTTHWNFGDGALQVRGGGQEVPCVIEGVSTVCTAAMQEIYYLTFDADPSQHWLETDDTNNRSWTKFRLERKGANASITVLEEYGHPGNTSNN
jgi:hypothetical protein